MTHSTFMVLANWAALVCILHAFYFSMRKSDRIKELERELRLNIKMMDDLSLTLNNAKKLLAVLTPEGEAEKLAAKKLADTLGGEAHNV